MDITLYARERGEGAPLVLLHGNGEDGSYFAHQLDYFARCRHVIALDTRGHGRSPRGTAPFTLEQFARDLEDFLDGRGLEQVELLGFSDGANIALLFALAHPERVRALVLNGGNLCPGGVRWQTQLPICLGWAITGLLSPLGEKARHNHALLNLMVTQPRIDPAALSALTVPTLVVAGERDMIRRKHTELIAASIPGAQLAILPGDHFVAAKNSGDFNAAVEAFLERGAIHDQTGGDPAGLSGP